MQLTAISFVGERPLSQFSVAAWADGPRVPVYPSDHFGLSADFAAPVVDASPSTQHSEDEAPAAGADIPPSGAQGS